MAIVQGGTPPAGGGEVGMHRLSIAAKLYTIFALLAAATFALAGVAVFNSMRHAALTAQVEAAPQPPRAAAGPARARARGRAQRGATRRYDLRYREGRARRLHVDGPQGGP